MRLLPVNAGRCPMSVHRQALAHALLPFSARRFDVLELFERLFECLAADLAHFQVEQRGRGGEERHY